MTWIPVSEHLNTKGEICIVTDGKHCGIARHYGCDPPYKWSPVDPRGYDWDLGSITHWMALPEPPEE